MITNNDAQAALLAWMQANTAILALDSNFPLEIREDYYQSEKFTYPNIRISCEVNPGECYDDCLIIATAFSEKKSSKEAQAIAGTIASELHKKSFTKNGIRFSAMIAETLRAVQEEGIWKATVRVNTKVK